MQLYPYIQMPSFCNIISAWIMELNADKTLYHLTWFYFMSTQNVCVVRLSGLHLDGRQKLYAGTLISEWFSFCKNK